jgi:hypothetical protein
VSVHLSDDNRADIDCFPEGLSLNITLLSDRTVHHEDDVIGLHCLLNLLHLIEELCLLLMPSRGIHDNDLHAFFFELGHTFLSDRNGVSLDVATIEGNSYLRCVLLELVKGTCSESISAYHCHSPSLLLIVVGDLAAGSCLTATLKSNKHDDICLSSFRLVRLLLNLEESRELFDNCGFDEDSEVSSLLLLCFELIHDVFSKLHDISNINIAAEQSVADFFETIFHYLFIYDCCFVEFLQGAGNLAAKLC